MRTHGNRADASKRAPQSSRQRGGGSQFFGGVDELTPEPGQTKITGHSAMMLHHDRHNPCLEGGRKYSKLEAMSISVSDVGAYRCDAIGLRDNLEHRTDVRQPNSHLTGQ